MTTVLLPPLPARVPDVGVTPSGIEATGAQLLAASAQIDDLGTFAAATARVTDWSGEAASAYHADIAALGGRADAMSLALRGVARRVQAHADAMEQLQRTHSDLESERTAIVEGIALLRQQVNQADQSEVASLQPEADRLARRVDSFGTEVSEFLTAVDTEESSMRTAFERVLDMTQIERRYSCAKDPADDALATKPPAGSSPAAVSAWWEGLSKEEQQAIMAAAPGAIGNLDGIPASVRDEANTVALDRDLGEWGSMDPDDLSDDERVWLENARAADQARTRIAGEFDPITGEPIEPQIYIYDPAAFDGDGTTAIGAGDLETADNVAVTVPGFGTDGESAAYMADRVGRMYEASRVLDPAQTNATMFWIGYDAPDNLPWAEGWDAAGVVSERMAERGGERLADTIDGLRESRAGAPAHLSVIGHSYGSTTTGTALGGEGLDVDDAILVGSPGLGGDNDHVDDLGLDGGHVWVGANSRDPVTFLGDEGWVDIGSFGGLGLGSNPAEDNFGAIRFEAESEHGSNPFDDHSKYFDSDSESLENIAHIVNGNYGGVEQADHLYDPWWGGVQDPEASRDARPVDETRTTR